MSDSDAIKPEEPTPGTKDFSKDGQAHNAIPDEIYKNLPPEVRRIITSTSFSGIMPMQNPLLGKITSEHITTVLSHSDEEDKRDRTERREERGHNYKVMVTALIFILIVGILLVYAQQIDILKYMVGAILGFAGGFGIGKYYRKEDK